MSGAKSRLRLVRQRRARATGTQAEHCARFARHAAYVGEWRSHLLEQLVEVELACHQVRAGQGDRDRLLKALRRAMHSVAAMHMVVSDVLLDVPPRLPKRRGAPEERPRPEASA